MKVICTGQQVLQATLFRAVCVALAVASAADAHADTRQDKIDGILRAAGAITELAPTTRANDQKLDSALRNLTRVLSDLTDGEWSIGGFDFGGAYGYVDGRPAPNPATNAMTCPSGYLTNVVSGRRGVDYPLTYCYRLSRPGQEPVFDYGGTWGYVEGALVPNAMTGATSCLPGYTAQQVMGQRNVDFPVFVCYRRHAPSTDPDAYFAGGFGYVDGLETNHPTTNAKACPEGSKKNRVYGTNGVDYLFYVCEINLRE